MTRCQALGAANTIRPSKMTIRQSASGISLGTAPRLPTRTRLLAFLEVLEEIGLRIQHQRRVLAPHRDAVRLERAVERVELGIRLVGLGVGLRRLALAFAAQAVG